MCVQVFGWLWRSGALPLDPPTDHGHRLPEFSLPDRDWLERRSCRLQPRPQPLKQNDIIATGGGGGVKVWAQCERDLLIEFQMHHMQFCMLPE